MALPNEIFNTILGHSAPQDWANLALVNTDFANIITRQQVRNPPLMGLYVLWSLSSTHRAIDTYTIKPWDDRQLVVHKATMVTGQPFDDLFEPWWTPKINKCEVQGDCWIFDQAKWINIIKQNEHFEAELVFANAQLHLKSLNGHKQAVPRGCPVFVEGPRICGRLNQSNRIKLNYWDQVIGVGHHHLQI